MANSRRKPRPSSFPLSNSTIPLLADPWNEVWIAALISCRSFLLVMAFRLHRWIDFQRPPAIFGLEQYAHSGLNRRKRVAKVVAEHTNELLAKL
jgi:hypothetical protein